MTIKIFSVVFLLAITLRQSQSREVCVPLPDCSLVLCEGPPENCEPINVPGQCCPDISHCKRCLVDGTYYEDGEEVPQTNPCQFCTCYNSELVCAIIDCAPPPPGCEGVIVPGQCCRDYSNCGLNCAAVSCLAPPKGCEPIEVPGQCCPDISHCPNRCFAYGTYYEDGEDIPQADPCQFCTCSNGESVCAIMDCARPPPDCQGVSVPGQCCLSYSHCGLNCAAVSCLAPPEGCEPKEIPGQCCPDVSHCT